MVSDNVFVSLVAALDTIVLLVIDLLFFPVNAVVGFIWGGIKFLVQEVLF